MAAQFESWKEKASSGCEKFRRGCAFWRISTDSLIHHGSAVIGDTTTTGCSCPADGLQFIVTQILNIDRQIAQKQTGLIIIPLDGLIHG
jgi:hypothetical protein